MGRYEKYKDSGVEWIGEIPEGWEMKKLKYIADLKSGNNLTSDKIKDFGEYPVLGGNGIRGYCSNYTHEGDFVVIGRQGALCGNINYASGKFWATDHAVVVSQIRKYEPFWLGELLRIMNLNQFSVAAAQPGLAVETIKNLIIPCPPLSIQTAISNYLNRKTEEIDKLIAQKERLIELYEEEKAAIINQAVTKGIDPDVKLKDSGVDWLGEIPEGWEVKRLKHMLTVNSGDGIKAAAIKEFGDYPVFGGNGIVGFTYKFNNCDEVFVIGRVGAKCGNIRLVTGKKWISDNALFAYATGNLKFLEMCLINLDLNRLANKNAQPLITSTMIKEQYVAYPSEQEQAAIVQHIEAETARIDAKITKTKHIIELQKEYRTALISEVVTGKIDVRDKVTI